MRRKRNERHPLELLVILLIFMFIAAGNAASSREVNTNVAEKIQIARAENTLAMADLRRIFAETTH